MYINTESKSQFVKLLRSNPQTIAMYLEDVVTESEQLADFDALRFHIKRELLPALREAFPEKELENGRK